MRLRGGRSYLGTPAATGSKASVCLLTLLGRELRLSER